MKDGLPESFITAEWNKAAGNFREQAAEINQLILNYNLEVPASALQMQQLSIERELELTSSSPSDTLPD